MKHTLNDLIVSYRNSARTAKASFEKYAIKLLQDHPEVKDKYQIDNILNFMYGYEEIPVGALHNDPKRILVVPDLHNPFTIKGGLEHCKNVYKQMNCEYVVFIGDILDNHFASYHEISTKAHGADRELELAIEAIKPWYEAFPNAHVTIGNHDRLHFRKSNSSGISSKWLKDYSEVLETPNWKWVHEWVNNGIYYVHGEGSTAKVTALRKGLPTVQGHHHSSVYIEYLRQDLWGMQVGSLIDKTAYAFEYAKVNTKEDVLGCAVVLDKLPILFPMNK